AGRSPRAHAARALSLDAGAPCALPQVSPWCGGLSPDAGAPCALPQASPWCGGLSPDAGAPCALPQASPWCGGLGPDAGTPLSEDLTLRPMDTPTRAVLGSGQLPRNEKGGSVGDTGRESPGCEQSGQGRHTPRGWWHNGPPEVVGRSMAAQLFLHQLQLGP